MRSVRMMRRGSRWRGLPPLHRRGVPPIGFPLICRPLVGLVVGLCAKVVYSGWDLGVSHCFRKA